MSQVELPPIWYRGFHTRTLSDEGNGAPGCGGASEIPMSCCVCELMETAPSSGEDTHAVVKKPKWAREHRLHTKCGPMQPWPIDGCSKQGRGQT